MVDDRDRRAVHRLLAVGDLAMSVELWTLEGTDEQIDEIISLLRCSLGAAEQSEIMHPETVSALRQWCNAERTRIHPYEYRIKFTPEQEIRAGLQHSRWWPFWESLTKDQEVRWTGTKSATYFVVDANPVYVNPDHERGPMGMFIELRRHTGKTFWTHIGQVRPLELQS